MLQYNFVTFCNTILNAVRAVGILFVINMGKGSYIGTQGKPIFFCTYCFINQKYLI